MRLRVNGENRDVMGAATLWDLWDEQARALGVEEPRGFAAALNGRLVPKERWPETAVQDGDEIEIIRAMSGG